MRALEGMVKPVGDFITERVLGEILSIPINVVDESDK